MLLLVAPGLALVLVLTVYPLLSVVVDSLFSIDYVADAPREFVGLQNFSELVSHRFFRVAARNTIVFTLGATLAEIALGLGLAVLFDRPFPGRRVAVPLMILPMMVSTMVASGIWRAWFHFDYGFLNNLLRALSLEPVPWLFDPNLALWSVMLVDVWQWTPLVFLILLAGLQSIPREIYEAAQLDGASSTGILVHVSLPLLRGHLLLALLLRTIDTFKIFDKVFALTGGGPGIATETLSMYVYRYGFKFFDLGLAASASVVMLIVASGLAAVYAVQILRRQGAPG